MRPLFFQGDEMNQLAGTRGISILAGAFFLVAGLATGASAQALQSTDRAFAGLSFGGQTKARTYTTSGSLPLYEETATFESSVGIGSEALFDLSGGVRVWNNVAVGLGFSRYSDTSDGTFNASIPDPAFFNSPHSVTATPTGLKHTESQFHVSVYWLQPVTDKVDVSVYAGPTFFSVKQDLPSGFTVVPGTATIATVTQTQVKENAVGLHGGVDVRYLILTNVGAGLFLRYAQGRVDTDAVDGGRMEVGGFQYGVGVRVRF
jgi:hypothetical protein